MLVFKIAARALVQITNKNIALAMNQIFNNYHSDSAYHFKAISRNSKHPNIVVFTHLALVKGDITVGYINIYFSVEIPTKQKNLKDQTLEIKTNDALIIKLLGKVEKLNDSIALKLLPTQKMTRCDLPSIQHPCNTQNTELLKLMAQAYQFENPQYDDRDPMSVLRADVLRDTTVNNKTLIANANSLSDSMNPVVTAALQNELFTLDDIDHLQQAYSQQLFSFLKDVLTSSLKSPLMISDSGFDISPVRNNHRKNITKSQDGTIYYTYTCDYFRFNHNVRTPALIVNSRKIEFQCAVGYLYGPHEVKFKLTHSHDKEKWVFELEEINTPNPIIYNILMGHNLGIENGKFVTIDPLNSTPIQTPDNALIAKP